MNLSLALSVAGPSEDAAMCLQLPGGEVWIGRDEDCDVVLPSELVSRRHVCLSVRGSELWVRDGSSNGTWIEGRRLRAQEIQISAPTTLNVGPYSIEVDTRDEVESSTAQPASYRREIRRRLLDHLDLRKLEAERLDPAALRSRVRRALRGLCEQLGDVIPSTVDLRTLIDELCDEALGLGPLEGLLADDLVSEIMVVDPTTVYVERKGRIERCNVRFTDADSVRSVLERIVTPLGRRIDESSPLVDARLADGSRVNAVIPPLATRGPCITIRKFSKRIVTFEQFVDWGSLTEESAAFLRAAVGARKNVVISGGTGSGKTTLLNLLSSAIPSHERIVTVEDAAELQLLQDHVVSLESRPANLEGRGEISIRDLVKNALRMRPDRILVGECRGAEALDMLQAMNTGHDGSMTTTHANSPREAVSRLETLCLMAGLNLPDVALRRQLSTSIDLVVQQARFSDGSRKVTHITELCGVDEHGDVVIHDIYRLAGGHGTSKHAAGGGLRATGYLPTFTSELADLYPGGAS